MYILYYRTDYPIVSRNMSSPFNISNLLSKSTQILSPLQVHRRSANVDAANDAVRETSWVNARWWREKGSCISHHHGFAEGCWGWSSVLRFIGGARFLLCVYVFFLDVDIATFTVIALRIAGKNYCCPVIFCAMINLTCCPCYFLTSWSRNKWRVGNAPMFNIMKQPATTCNNEVFPFFAQTQPLHLWCEGIGATLLAKKQPLQSPWMTLLTLNLSQMFVTEL